MNAREKLETLFRECTVGIEIVQGEKLAYTQSVNIVMSSMKTLGIIALDKYPGDLVDARLLAELKDIVAVAWGNIEFSITRHSMQNNDAPAGTARGYIRNIAVATKAIEGILNKRAEQRDRDSLEALFENCTHGLQKPSATTPQKAYQVIDKMRREAWDFLKNEAQGQFRPTLNLIAVLEEFRQQASSNMDALAGGNKAQQTQVDKAIESLDQIQKALQAVRGRQTERERQNALGPIESMRPPAAPREPKAKKVVFNPYPGADMSGIKDTHALGMAESANVRGLLDELKRLSVAEAPARLEGPGGVLNAIGDTASWVYNNANAWTTPGYVADRCKDVLAVCGERLDPPPAAQAHERAMMRKWSNTVIQASLKKNMQRLEKALRVDDLRLHAWMYGIISGALRRAIPRLAGVEDQVAAIAKLKKMKSDTLERKFIVFVEAMQAYVHQNSKDFDRAETSHVGWLMRTDQELGYTTVADKLETLLEVFSHDLEKYVKGLTKKVERIQQALRNAELSGQRQDEQKKNVRLVVWVAGQGQYNLLLNFAVRLATEGLFTMHGESISVNSSIKSICSKLLERAERENEGLPKVLASFFEAFDEYKEGHPEEFSTAFEGEEQERLEAGVLKLDEALGYTIGFE